MRRRVTINMLLSSMLLSLFIFIHSSQEIEHIFHLSTTANATITNQEHDGSKMCLHRRGQNGTWVESNGYFYFGDKGPPVNHSKWTWQDNAVECQIKKLQPKEFCEVMQNLELKRIYFVGDSLAYLMVESLWRLLGNRDGKSENIGI